MVKSGFAFTVQCLFPNLTNPKSIIQGTHRDLPRRVGIILEAVKNLPPE